MRFWLAAFVLVFAAVELFNWFAALGSWHPTGLWLLLGGVGLALLSNLPTPSDETVKSTADDKTEGTPQAQNKATHSSEPVAQVSAGQGQAVAPLSADKDKDSVSFKVRPLKR
ncbi:MAG: hypothetical protein AAFV85_19465 [Cyanobacteria bacterium J06634_6]